MITLEDWALIRRLHLSEGVSKAQIARDLGISRNTVANAVASVDPPEYSRSPVVTSFDPFEQQVRQLLKGTPSMPATVLAERVGWAGSATWFRQNVAVIRPDYAPTDPADRIVYHPGDQVQCDLWFPEPRIPVGDGSWVMLPVLVMVASFSKFISAVMIPSRTTADLLAGMWVLLSQQLGAVPRRLIWDNETGIGRRNRLAAGVGGFAGALATKIQQLKAYDPESKGGVERMNGFFETSFLPGREFESPGDFNTQMGIWLPKANARTVRALKARPVDLLGVDKAAMLVLPPVAPAHGFAGPSPVAPGLLRPGVRQRLLGPPDSDRADGRRGRRSGRGRRPARRSCDRRPPTVVGQRVDDHRPRPRQCGSQAAGSLSNTRGTPGVTGRGGCGAA